MVVYMILSLLSGVVSGVLVPPIGEGYSFGTVGNAIMGFLGGAVAFIITGLALGGTNLIVAIVAGFLGGALIRVGLAVFKIRANNGE